ncbi:LOW QUALITY PROTEIN: hypothetical protein Cgig2_011312 [Carnegiea gigantea]|uniref:Uncharacterized protein n=1 Tax=Carnegiea gigantea TaxID=171969 RepID=A0A9Q1GKL9_9CARY|nr:LOW QUALITY PROTEIN: hypothetical protein Cgig2_011312 [Carnegiea gigantea]
MDALESLMSTMADAITRQVSEQVRRAMEAASLARPHPPFDYPLVHEREPSHRPERMLSPRYAEHGRELSRSDWSGRPNTGQLGRRATMGPTGRLTQGETIRSIAACTPYATHSRGHPMLRRPPFMTAPPKPQNARKYYGFHEQSGHTTIERRELKKALHELADKGQIDRFLRIGPRFLRREQEPTPPLPRDEECSTEVVATIAGGYTEGITRLAWKTKSKSLEVDFLVVDVPTTYNVILVRPTLCKGREEKIRRVTRRALHHHHALPPQKPRPRLLGGCILALGGRRDKLHLLKVTALNGGPLALIHVVEAGSSGPCVGTRGCRCGLAGSPAPYLGLHQPRPSPVDAAAPSSQPHVRLNQPRRRYRATSPFRNSPHPSSEDLSHGCLFLGHLGGIRSPRSYQVPGLNYVLDKRELGGRFWKGWGAFAWRGYGPLMTGSPIDEGPIARLPLSPLARVRRPRPRLAGPRSAIAFEPVGLRQASFHGERGTVPVGKRLSLYNLGATRSGDELGCTLYLFGLLTNEALPLLFPPTLSVGRPLFGGGIPGLEDRQPCPRLICIKQKGSQDQKAGRGEEEVIGEKLLLGERIQRLPVTGLAPPPLGALH